ncbi:MAG: methyltransferase [Candidatus Altiarchaeota archaeon]|nr:methyltransferase [Candidatus Altiarchaeota archaeon]
MYAGKMVFYFRDLQFTTHPEVYEPAEDSMLLAENLHAGKGETVLDIGTGTGIQAIVAARTAGEVVAVDINPKALEVARENAALNSAGNIEFRLSDLFSAIGDDERFDLIVFNPPYLPACEKGLLERSWAGGRKGSEVICRFIESVGKYLNDAGCVELLVSSLNNLPNVLEGFRAVGFEPEVMAGEKLWFEELYVIAARKFL